MGDLLADRWRTRAPRAPTGTYLTGKPGGPMPGPAYTRDGRVTACWVRIFEARLIHAERVVKGGWLP